MKISGVFTKDEIKSALILGARIENAKGGQTILRFQSKSVFTSWIKDQKDLYPERWKHLIKIKTDE